MQNDKRKQSPDHHQEQRKKSFKMSLTLADLVAQLDQLKKSIKEDFETALTKIMTEVNIIKKKVDHLDAWVNTIEQNALNNTALIFGLPGTINSQPSAIFKAIATQLNFNYTDDDLKCVKFNKHFTQDNGHIRIAFWNPMLKEKQIAAFKNTMKEDRPIKIQSLNSNFKGGNLT